MENSFKAILDESKSILILLPTKPYFDQVASGLALYLALRDKKEVQISCPTPMIVEFNRLVGVNKISQEVGNKNLIIKFTDYKASNIERVSYDIEGGQFRLTVIPKQRFNPPAKDQIQASYSGISADCIILIGGVNESHFPAISSKDLVGAKLVHIGTKDLSLMSGKGLISFSRPASSVSELVAALMNESGLEYDADISTNLLTGIEEGSGKFTDSNVGAQTFELAAGLIRAGGKRQVQATWQRGSYPQASPAAQMPKEESAQIDEELQKEEPPKDWLRPKIYKGTSIS